MAWEPFTGKLDEVGFVPFEGKLDKRKPEDVGYFESAAQAGKRGLESLADSPEGYGIAKEKLFGTEQEVAKRMAEAKAAKAVEKESGLSFADLQRIYKEQGLASALSQAPKYITEQVLQSAPQMAIPLVAGEATTALTAPILGPAAPIAGLVAGVGTYGAQQFGNFMKRQAEEAQRPEDISVGRAAGAAAVTAPIGFFADKLTAGLGSLGQKGIVEVGKELAKRKAAGEIGTLGVAAGITKQAGKGATVGIIAEAPTEVLEAVGERWQAGLSLTDEDARNEYLENFMGAAAAGAGIGAPGRARQAYKAYAEAPPGVPTAGQTPPPQTPTAPPGPTPPVPPSSAAQQPPVGQPPGAPQGVPPQANTQVPPVAPGAPPQGMPSGVVRQEVINLNGQEVLVNIYPDGTVRLADEETSQDREKMLEELTGQNLAPPAQVPEGIPPSAPVAAPPQVIPPVAEITPPEVTNVEPPPPSVAADRVSLEVPGERPPEPPTGGVETPETPPVGSTVPTPPATGTGEAEQPPPLKAIWRSADFDFPVEVIGQPKDDPNTGRKFVEVLYNNNKTFVPYDELVFEKPPTQKTPSDQTPPQTPSQQKAPQTELRQSLLSSGWKLLSPTSDRTLANPEGEKYFTFEKNGTRIALSGGPFENMATLQSIVVDPDKRKQGLATAAIDELTKFADKQKITLYAKHAPTEANGPSAEALRNFYKKFEFDYLGDTLDLRRLPQEKKAEPEVVNNKTPSPDLPADKRLVLMPCSSMKGPGRAKASDLYKGVFFQTFNGNVKEGGKPNVVILSAKHGFLSPDDEIDPYDEKLDKAKTEDFVQNLNRIISDKIDLSGIEDVLIVGGKDYQRVMKAYVQKLINDGIVSKDASINATSGEIGEQRSQLGKYLQSINVPVKPPVPPETAPPPVETVQPPTVQPPTQPTPSNIPEDRIQKQLTLFQSGDYAVPLGISGTGPEGREIAKRHNDLIDAVYTAAVKRFLEGDLTAKVPTKKQTVISLEKQTDLSPKPITKGVQSKPPMTTQSQKDAMIKVAADGDIRYYLNGVHIDEARKAMVSTDGHRLAVLKDPVLTELPPNRPDKSFTVIGPKNEWIDGKFPDWEKVVPKSHGDKMTIEAAPLGDYARGVKKASRYAGGKLIAMSVDINGKNVLLNPEYVADMTDLFRRFGYNTFEVSFTSTAPGKQELLMATSSDGKLTQVIMPVREKDTPFKTYVFKEVKTAAPPPKPPVTSKPPQPPATPKPPAAPQVQLSPEDLDKIAFGKKIGATLNVGPMPTNISGFSVPRPPSRRKLELEKSEKLSEAIANNDQKAVLNELSKSKNPIIAEVARLGAELKIKFGLYSDAPKADANRWRIKRFSAVATYTMGTRGGGSIYAKDFDVAKTEDTIAHEITHLLTSTAIDYPTDVQKPYVKNLESLYDHVKKTFAKKGITKNERYALTNLKEFVAEGNSNPDFQYELSKIVYQNKTAWGAFTTNIARLLGIKNDNAFAEFLALSENLSRTQLELQRSSQTGGPGVVSPMENPIASGELSARDRFPAKELKRNNVPNYKSREKLIEINIDDFLNLANESKEGSYNSGKLQDTRSYLKNDGRFDTLPYLQYDYDDKIAEVIGHEGRHRAMALKELGYTTMPVILRGPIRWSEQADPSRFDYEKQFPTKLKAQERAKNPNFSIPFPVTRESADTPYETLAEEGAARTNYQGGPIPLSQWSMTGESKLDNFLYKLQDKNIDLKRVIQEVNYSAGQIADRFNPYQLEELYHGRTSYETQNFLKKDLLPILETLRSNDISLQDFETFLHARHAEERNDYINGVNRTVGPNGTLITNPAVQDKGSGMETQFARNYLASIPADKRRVLDALGNDINNIVKDTQRILVDGGIEKQSTIDAWNNVYSNYVPLMRDQDELDFVHSSSGMGQGFSVKGGFSKNAYGSTKTVVDVFNNIALQREKAINKAEKARVGRALYGLAITAPNPDFWLPVNPSAIKDKAKLVAEFQRLGIPASEIDNLIQEPKVPVYDKNNRIVRYQVNPAYRASDNVFSARVNGEDRFVFFNPKDQRALRMAASMKNLDAEQLGVALGTVANMTRWIASVNTQFNPVFGAWNFTRDVQSAAINLSSTPLANDKAEVLSNVWPALATIYKDLRGSRSNAPAATTQMASYWERFQKAGGKTGYRDQFSKTAQNANLVERELAKLNKGNVKKAADAVFNWLSDYNDAMENAVRVAAFKVAVEKGMSDEKAASLAKNLTVNFNRRGQISPIAGSLYAFFNASVQGTARLANTLFVLNDPKDIRSVRLSPTGKKIVAGGMALGVFQALALAMAGYDDDEPPEFLKDKNLILPTGGGKYLIVPMPLGFNVLPGLGRITTEYILGQAGLTTGAKGAGDKLSQAFGLIVDSFNPLGSSGFAQTLAPTIADPFIAVETNKDAFGRPIHREDRATNPTPGYLRTRENASVLGKGLAEFLNYVSGGTKYQKGAWSPTGDDIDYLVGQVTGGVGREIIKAGEAVKAVATGEELPSYRVPIAGKLYGETDTNSAISDKFYKNVTRLSKFENEIKGRAKNQEDVQGFLKDHPDARLWSTANNLENTISKITKTKRQLLERPSSPEIEETIKRLDAQKYRMMKNFNEQVKNLERQ